MIVCYACGHGLGHLTRIRAALHTLSPGEPATVLTTSPYAEHPAVGAGLAVRTAPAGLRSDDLAAWFADAVRALAPREVLIDAFPAGLHGELTGRLRAAVTAAAPGVTVTHLARMVRWETYRALVPAEPMRYDRTWLVEPLAPDQMEYLASVSAAVKTLALTDPPADPSAPLLPDTWLIVHSGPASEVAELVRYARDTATFEDATPDYVLITADPPADLPADVRRMDRYPAWPLFPSAARIFTAAGYNAVRQLAAHRERHRMLPFPRRFDDQFARAARARVDAPATGRPGT